MIIFLFHFSVSRTEEIAVSALLIIYSQIYANSVRISSNYVGGSNISISNISDNFLM